MVVLFYRCGYVIFSCYSIKNKCGKIFDKRIL